MATDILLNMGRAQRDGYTIQDHPLGLVVMGQAMPASDISGVVKIAEGRGYRFIFPGIAEAIGAFMVISSKENGEEWLKQLAATGDWLHGGDTGMSSRTIYYVFTGEGWRDGVPSIPRDPDDFGRCYRLLKLHPEWVPRLGEMSARYPEWTELVKHWPNLTTLYERDLDTGRCEELYTLMQALRGITRPSSASEVP